MKHENFMFALYGAGTAVAVIGIHHIYEGRPAGWVAVFVGLALNIGSRYWHTSVQERFVKEAYLKGKEEQVNNHG